MVRLIPPDTVLVLVLVIIVSIGATMVYSASSAAASVRYNDAGFFIRRHMAGLFIAFIVALLFTIIDYTQLRPLCVPLMAGSIMLLLIMALSPSLTREAGGASRWLRIAGLSFQPSELAKLSLILFLADYFSYKPERINNIKTLIVPVGVTGLTCWLVLIQRDLSTAFILVALAFIMLFLAGLSMKKLMFGMFMAAGGVTHAIIFERYRLRRIMAFLDPWADPHDSGYHVIQSLIAVGSGGLDGLGLTASRQKLRYLPEPFTDFIYAVIGEELGFVGCVTVLLLFMAVIIRGVRVARRASDQFGFLLASGIVAWIGIQAFVNIGVVLNLLPATGLPLPFISYGRTALISIAAGVGVLLSVSRRVEM